MPNVSLGDHFEEFINRQIAQGRFQNASEVVQALQGCATTLDDGFVRPGRSK
jgi:hypothetical protein